MLYADQSQPPSPSYDPGRSIPLSHLPLPARYVWLSTDRVLQLMTSAETVKVPQMAESITEGTLKQWNKAVGDFVKQDEEIATIETDKASPP